MRARSIRLLLLSVVSAALMSAAADTGEDSDEYDFDRWYVGASATIVLPQGGHPMRHVGGATARAGYYFTESLAVEADASWLENCVGLGMKGLWHVFGYERFDPFMTVGARGWIDGDVGPSAGLGAFYHMTDNWSFRADAEATLGLDGDCAMVYSIGAGVQYSF